jgi:hypothetical protein
MKDENTQMKCENTQMKGKKGVSGQVGIPRALKMIGFPGKVAQTRLLTGLALGLFWATGYTLFSIKESIYTVYSK